MENLIRKSIMVLLLIAASALCFGETLVVGRGGKFRNIQDAINTAGSGDDIVIKSGTYAQNDSLFINEKTDIEIKGEGKVTIACTEYVPVIYILQSDKITISNIHGLHRVTDPEVGKGLCGPGATIITAEGCNGVFIRQCELNGCGQIGFEGISSNRIVLEDNYIHDNVYGAVSLSWIEGGEEPDVRIGGNRLENNFGPVIVVPREGVLDMYFRDTDEAPGIVMLKNIWTNNDKMPRKSAVLNGERIVFWGPPEAYQNEAGESVVVSGILDRDTGISVGDEMYNFRGRSVIEFYENGQVRAGFFTGTDSILLEDGSEADLPAGARLEFRETGALKSAELEDGTVVEFEDNGIQPNDPDEDNGGQYEDDHDDDFDIGD
ncbi:MAG: right-handed parallel beta-helix repeat-containing protein [Spirochaetales bacterium]|nr:right-handed parallel beta-helix repeat-containing protein [Spirochaetales bacterium]